MNLTAPPFLAATSARDVVGINVAAGVASSPTEITSFGQVFKEGQFTSSQNLAVKFGNTSEAVQVDAKTFYADGSIEFAVLTFQQPGIQANTTLQGMLETTTAQLPTLPVDLTALLSSHSISVQLSYANSSLVSYDVGNALKTALSTGTAETWMSGPLATQARVSIPVDGSLRLLVTVTAFADGTFSATVGFNNDIAMSSQGGTETYSANIIVDNVVKYQQSQISQAQYQDWNTTVWGGGGSPQSTTIQHDPAYLESAAAIPNFDLKNGVDAGKVASYAGTISQPTWNQPLSNNDVEMLMPTTGGRGDIGITTEANAVWLITQDPTAQAYALGQANASNAAPWNYWNAQAGTWLNTDQYSNIWTDNRGGTSDGGSVGLTQQVSGQTGWEVETAHQPDLSYYAYLMTGDEKYLDSLNSQASFAITNTWEAYRGSDQIVVGADQVRASAWNIREIDEAAWANPSGSAEGAYFTKIADANWSWLVAQIPSWTAKQGQAYGQMEGYAWGSRSYSRPWMQDYFASVAAEAARHGNSDARTFLAWESNFLVGRFLNGANGFNPHDGVSYTLAMGPDASDGNVRYQTWAQIGQATVAAGESNGTGWSNSVGDYGMLGLVTLADIITVLGSTDAIRAYNYLLTSGAPFITASDRADNNQFNIIPSLPNGWSFASDGTIVQDPAASSNSSTASTNTNASSGSSGTSPGQVSTSTSPVITSPNITPITTSPALPASTVLPTTSSLPTNPTLHPSSPGADNSQDTTSPQTQRTVSIQSTTLTMYRFFDQANGTHFYTADSVEAAGISNPSSASYRPELSPEASGFATLPASAADTDSNVIKVSRLFSSVDGTHFFTASQDELSALTSPGSSTYRPDLIYEASNPFYAHSQAEQGDIAVYRFFDTNDGTHFFTSTQSEMNQMRTPGSSDYRSDMIYEGVAFYAPASSK